MSQCFGSSRSLPLDWSSQGWLVITTEGWLSWGWNLFGTMILKKGKGPNENNANANSVRKPTFLPRSAARQSKWFLWKCDFHLNETVFILAMPMAQSLCRKDCHDTLTSLPTPVCASYWFSQLNCVQFAVGGENFPSNAVLLHLHNEVWLWALTTKTWVKCHCWCLAFNQIAPYKTSI